MRTGAQAAIAALAVALVVSICFATGDLLGYRIVALILLLTVSVLAMLLEFLPVLLAAVASGLLLNFLFIPPRFTFHIDNSDDFLLFAMYLVISVVSAALSWQIRREQEKSRDREEKAKAVALYDTLLNSLSHELRTPIAAILGAVDTLQSHPDIAPQQAQELLAEIDLASVRLNRQVENLLNMSRLESGMLRPKLDWCDLEDSYGHALQQLDGSRHALVFLPNANLPLCKVDAVLLGEVLSNLLSNAIQYTAAGTKIEVRAEAKDAQLHLTVADEGPGVAADELPRLFEKFYRVPQTKAGGTGLGLAIAKGYVEAMGGTIRASRHVPSGLRIDIYLPVEFSYVNQLRNE